MRAYPLRLIVVLVAGLLASLACNRFPLRLPFDREPIPPPSTAIAGATATQLALEGVPTVTPTPPEATPTPAGAAVPRLEAGQPLTVSQVLMVNATTGWAVGQGQTDAHDHILRTTDGGTLWHDVSPPEPVSAQGAQGAAAYFLNAEIGWVTYFDRQALLPPTGAAVWVTRDAGRSWTPSQPLDLSGIEQYAPTDLVFVDAQHGWLMAHVGAGMSHDYVVVFGTRDGGQTWERLADPYNNALPMSCVKNGLAFAAPNLGWVAGDCLGVTPGVYFQRSTDGGRTWAAQALPPPPDDADLFASEAAGCGTYSLSPLPPQGVRVAVACRFLETGEEVFYLYTSPDAGETWQVNDLPARQVLFLEGGQGWALEDGDTTRHDERRLYRTANGGQAWEAVSIVNWAAQFDFVSPQLGWAVARAGDEIALVATADGGATWQMLAPRVAGGAS